MSGRAAARALPLLLAAAVGACATAPPPPSPFAPFLGRWRGSQGETVRAFYEIGERDGRLEARSEYRVAVPGQPAPRRVTGDVGGIRAEGRALSFTVVYEGGGAPIDGSAAIYDLVAEGDTLRGRGQNLRTRATFDVLLRRDAR